MPRRRHKETMGVRSSGAAGPHPRAQLAGVLYSSGRRGFRPYTSVMDEVMTRLVKFTALGAAAEMRTIASVGVRAVGSYISALTRCAPQGMLGMFALMLL